jgi:hypothetical protein
MEQSEISKLNKTKPIMEPELKEEIHQTPKRQVSNDTGIVIGCCPGTTRPDSILKSILEQIDELSEDDFIVKTKSFGDWDFAIYTDKKDILDKNYDKIFDLLQMMYKYGRIRYASIY